MTGERIEVGQTAAEREEAIRGLTVNDRIEYRIEHAPDGMAEEADLWWSRGGYLTTAGGRSIRRPDGQPKGEWRGDPPILVLLAVIKGAPVFDPQPGDVWGDPEDNGERMIHDPSTVGVNRWIVIATGPKGRTDTARAERIIRERGWVLLVRDGKVVGR